MSERKCEDFIDTYMRYTAPLESPDNYHRWCALSMLAMAVRRKVWVEMGYFRIYPNLFIILVGPAGARKGTAINAACDLVDDVDDPAILKSADSITREALIRAMERATRKVEIENYSYTHASYSLISKELGVMLKQNSHDFMMLLTDLFDSSKMWKYETVSRSEEKLKNVWLNFLAATTPKWLRSGMPEDAIGGGFTSRVLFIVEQGVRHKKAIPKLTPKILALREDLIHDFRIMCEQAGPMRMTEKCEAFFVKWYEEGDETLTDSHFHGYNARKHVHLLKIATLIAISKGSYNTIELAHMEEGLSYLANIEPNMVKAFDSVGRSEAVEDIAQIQELFETERVVSKSQLRRVTFRDVDLDRFDKIIQLLLETKFIRIVEIKADGDNVYEYIPQEEV